MVRPQHLSVSLAVLLALGIVAVAPVAAQTSPPNAIHFQGRLATSSGNPVPDGAYSVRFRFYDAPTAGNVLYEKTLASVAVKNGTFAVLLDAIGATAFNTNTWIGIQIGTDAELSPRTQIVSVPYAIKSDIALTVPDGSLTLSKFASGVLNANAWLLGGNSGVTTGFLGTTDNQPLEFRVRGRRAMRYQSAENTATAGSEYRSINILGGSEINEIAAGVVGATIAGGGQDYFTATDFPNRVTANFGTIGGGSSNLASGQYTAVAGGSFNTAGNLYATVAGGFFNVANGQYSTISGGYSHIAGGIYSTIAGGFNNTTSTGPYATVAGGFNNIASVDSSAVGGGSYNTASGQYATVAGGLDNTAGGAYSFAAGRRAKAISTGTFVWADNTDTDFTTTGPGQFLIRAGGGVGINNTNPGRAILRVHNASTIVGIAAGDLAPVGAASFESHRVTNTGSYHLACTNSGVDVFYVNGSGRPFGTGSYVTLSDARYKRNVNTVENALDAILNLRGVTYEWDTEKWKERGLPNGKQIGFIAQEVEKVLPELVTTDSKGYKMVSYSDAVPVLVEAIKTLNARSVLQQKQIDELKRQNNEIAELKAAIAELQAKR